MKNKLHRRQENTVPADLLVNAPKELSRWAFREGYWVYYLFYLVAHAKYGKVVSRKELTEFLAKTFKYHPDSISRILSMDLPFWEVSTAKAAEIKGKDFIVFTGLAAFHTIFHLEVSPVIRVPAHYLVGSRKLAKGYLMGTAAIPELYHNQPKPISRAKIREHTGISESEQYVLQEELKNSKIPFKIKGNKVEIANVTKINVERTEKNRFISHDSVYNEQYLTMRTANSYRRLGGDRNKRVEKRLEKVLGSPKKTSAGQDSSIYFNDFSPSGIRIVKGKALPFAIPHLHDQNGDLVWSIP